MYIQYAVLYNIVVKRGQSRKVWERWAGDDEDVAVEENYRNKINRTYDKWSNLNEINERRTMMNDNNERKK